MTDDQAIGEKVGDPAAPPDDLPPRDTARARWMFWIAFGYLVILAAMLPQSGSDAGVVKMPLYHAALPYGLFACWAIVLSEGLFGGFSASDRSRAALYRLALVALLPPFRMVVSPRRPNEWVWIPRYGWLRVSDRAVSEMEQRTAIPMLFATALIVPVLVVDFGFAETVQASQQLQLALAVLVALIWFSFALEFVIMVSLAPKKLAYCRKHWINIVIVLLPLLAFLRSLQLFRFLRVARASKLAKVYRLRGLTARLLKIALAFNLVERIMAMNPEKHAAQLEEKIAEKEKELADLHLRLSETREKIARSQSETAEAERIR